MFKKLGADPRSVHRIHFTEDYGQDTQICTNLTLFERTGKIQCLVM